MGKSSKNSSDEIQSIITEAKKNKLKATIDWNNITVNNTERLVKHIASGKIRHKKAQNRYNSIMENDVSKIFNSRKYELQKKLRKDIFRKLKGIFVWSKAYDDKTDDETDYKTSDEIDYNTDDKQPDTTDMPDLKSEESS